MEKTETPELIKAFVKAQSQFKSALKDATNPHLKSKYADLASIWDACKDALHENGLVVSQQTAGSETGWHLITRLYHEAGGYLESTTPILAPATANAQQFGSGITYSRRYALAAILGIVTDDDDAEGAMNRNSQQQARNTPPAAERNTPAEPEPNQATAKQKAEIIKLLNHPTITMDEKNKMLLALNKFDQQKAEEKITSLQKTIKGREEVLNAEANAA